MRDEFPLVKVMARAFDRGHAIELIKAGVDYQIREMFESALAFGGEALAHARRRPTRRSPSVIERRARARPAALRRCSWSAGCRPGRDLLISNAEEQARESGAVERPSEPVMLDEAAGQDDQPAQAC